MDRHENNIADLDLPAIAGRIRETLAELRLTGTQFAGEIGFSYNTLRSYMGTGSNARPPSPEFLAAAYRKFGVMPSWLLTGDGPSRKQEPAAAADHLSSEFVVIPVLGVRAAAGIGMLNEPSAEYRVGGLCFSRSWLASRGLSAQHLRVIQVRGASMDKVLAHGDQVLIDQSDTQPRSGFVYVIRQGDELLVKYCQLLPGGILRVSSANQDFAPYDVDLNKTPDVAIVGRVVASMHEW